MTFSGTKEQAIKQAVARFGTSKNPVVTAKPKQQGVAEANLSELNKDTVYSYAKKAHKDQDKQSTITGKAYLDNDPKTANKAHHKFSMRAAGLDRAEKRLNKEGVAEGWKDVVAGGALALGALGAGAQTMPNINAQQVELTNKYYNALVQRAKEDGRELDRRTLNFLKAKAEDAAALKLQQASPKKQQGFPAQGSERRVSRNIDNFESQGVAEGMSDDMAAMAQKKFPNAYISKDGEEVQKPKNWSKRYTPPAAAPADLEKQQRDLTAKYPNIDELVRRAELNRDPNYEMADGEAYYAARDAEQNYLKLKQIQRVIQGLNESLQRTQP
jgi:hypothetical protein